MIDRKMLHIIYKNLITIDRSTSQRCKRFLYKHTEVPYHQVFNNAGSKFIFAQIRELAKDRRYKTLKDSLSIRFDKGVDNTKMKNGIKTIPTNLHVRDAKIRDDKHKQDRCCDLWEPSQPKGKKTKHPLDNQDEQFQPTTTRRGSNPKLEKEGEEAHRGAQQMRHVNCTFLLVKI